jgi:putative DNA primase/helicase
VTSWQKLLRIARTALPKGKKSGPKPERISSKEAPRRQRSQQRTDKASTMPHDANDVDDDALVARILAGQRRLKELEQVESKKRGRKQAAEGGHDRSNADATPLPDDIHLTDLGNARRVVSRHGKDLRYCHPFKRYFIFDGGRWAEDQTGAAVRLVKETQSALYRETALKIMDLSKLGNGDKGKEEPRLLKHCLSWEDAKRIYACLQLIASEPGIPILPADMDRDPFLLNVRNGTLDLRTGKLREHRREDLITKLVPVNYDPDARCPLWHKFLDRIMAGNQGLVTYLQRTAGYSLTGDVGEQVLFFLYGLGANGKSTYLATLKDLLGDYGLQAVPELLMVKNTEAHPTERADLFGKRFVCTIETEQGKRVAEALMKQLTGGDEITARRMRQDFFRFPPTWKIYLAANHKPNIRGTDQATWRRIKLIPFTVTIPKAERDQKLSAKLKAEWPGILAWMVRGCLDRQHDGLAEPREVTEATNSYRVEQDTIQVFMDESCFVHDQVKVRTTLLFEAYQRWSGDRLTTPQAFRKCMEDKGFKSKRGHGGYWFYHGIGLPATEAGDGGLRQSGLAPENGSPGCFSG